MEIEFIPYRPNELSEILFARARDGLSPNAWGQDVLAKLAKNAGGDACVAIQGLRQAAVAAESIGRERLSAGGLPKTAQDSGENKREQIAGRLSHHERLIDELIMKNEPIHTMDLRCIYNDACRAGGIPPIARRTFSKYEKLLGDSGLIIVDSKGSPGKGRLLRIHPA